MTGLRSALGGIGTWCADLLKAWRDPFDVEPDPEPNSDYPSAAIEDFGCPDTQPSTPGALDTDLGDLTP